MTLKDLCVYTRPVADPKLTKKAVEAAWRDKARLLVWLQKRIDLPEANPDAAPYSWQAGFDRGYRCALGVVLDHIRG